MAVDDSKKPVHEIPVVAPREELWGQASGGASTAAPGNGGHAASRAGAHSAPAAPSEPGLPPMPPPGAPVAPPTFASGATPAAPVGGGANPYSSAPPPPVAPAPVMPSGGMTAAPPLAPVVFPAVPVAAPVAPPTAAASNAPQAPGLPTRITPKNGTTPDPALDEALTAVLKNRASDLHVTANAQPMLRIDGSLTPVQGSGVWSGDKVRRALMSLLTPEQQSRFLTEYEYDFAYSISDRERFRVNMYLQRGEVGAAFRLIPTEIPTLSGLGMPAVVGEFSKLPRGLVLVTGPTGSGKSTTLAAIIDVVNRTRADHIVTVEDPIEFIHENKKALVNQREVGADTHSFHAALKHVLRQDPDVILVGEMRDLETISVALTAAETGHLVFATLHTQDASQTIDRIIDVYPPHQQAQVRTQLSGSLQGIISQTLVKRAKGKGRVVATEVLMATHAVTNLIREGKTHQIPSAMQAGRELGMHTMDQSLADLVNSGEITYDVALTKTHDPAVLKRLVTRESSTTSPFGQAHDDVDYAASPVDRPKGS